MPADVSTVLSRLLVVRSQLDEHHQRMIALQAHAHALALHARFQALDADPPPSTTRRPASDKPPTPPSD